MAYLNSVHDLHLFEIIFMTFSLTELRKKGPARNTTVVQVTKVNLRKAIDGVLFINTVRKAWEKPTRKIGLGQDTLVILLSS